MDEFNILVFVVGLALLGAALLPLRLKKIPVSLPIIYLGAGMIFPFILPDLSWIDPLTYSFTAQRLTELAVIISLVSAGLKIDRLISWKGWGSTWRLLGITMPLCIAGLAIGSYYLMGFSLAAAILLGAVMAPTDPVLASDVQVGPAGGDEEEHEVRFALTSEAGLNDSFAFPFVNLALVIAASGLAIEGLAEWFAVDVLWKLSAGLGMGLLSGYIIATVVHKFRHESVVQEGFVSLSLTLLTYGITEIIYGYGFLAVFVAARAFRRHELNDNEYNKELHSFSEQVEIFLMAILLVMLGVSISQGLFYFLTWEAIGLSLIFLLVIRPLSGLLALIGTGIETSHKFLISIFGIRGIGSFFYLAYALNHSNIGEKYGDILWATVGFIVVVSIFLHGVTASYAMRNVS